MNIHKHLSGVIVFPYRIKQKNKPTPHHKIIQGHQWKPHNLAPIDLVKHLRGMGQTYVKIHGQHIEVSPQPKNGYLPISVVEYGRRLVIKRKLSLLY